jgi:nitrate reductase NapD
MAKALTTRTVDRRLFLHGLWGTKGRDQADGTYEVASILVQARPERLEAAGRAIEALPGTAIYSRDPKGKLVVVVEATSVGVIGDLLHSISLMPDVLTAALVFQGTDDGRAA